MVNNVRLKGNCMQTNYVFIQVITNRARVARLFMIDYDEQMPHIVPVFFAFDSIIIIYHQIEKEKNKHFKG